MVQSGENKVKGEESRSTSVEIQDDLEEFNSFYPEIVKALEEKSQELMPDMDDVSVTDWMVKILDYNVKGGKKLRGLMIPITYRSLVENPSPEDMKLAYVLGWVGEMLQGASLIADDIMDNSETRRGKLCWYKVKDVGMTAVNDLLLVENLAYELLRIYFHEKSYYFDLYNAIKDVVIKTIYGQGLDCKMGQCEKIVDSFTTERYAKIVKYKTSYYTMYLPVALAFILAGKHKNKAVMKAVEEIMLEVGHYFQVQDDYLDCFGDEEITGKIGTDIQDNKCSWLFVQALERCTPEQLDTLLHNYGHDNPLMVEKVKNLYRDLELDEVFGRYETEAQRSIMSKMEELPGDISRDVFMQLFLKIYQRKK